MFAQTTNAWYLSAQIVIVFGNSFLSLFFLWHLALSICTISQSNSFSNAEFSLDNYPPVFLFFFFGPRIVFLVGHKYEFSEWPGELVAVDGMLCMPNS